MNLCWPNSFALFPDFLFWSDFQFAYESRVKSIRIGKSSSNCIGNQDFQRPRHLNDFPYRVSIPNKLKWTTLVWRFKWHFWFTIAFFWKSQMSNNPCVNYVSQASNSRWEKAEIWNCQVGTDNEKVSDFWPKTVKLLKTHLSELVIIVIFAQVTCWGMNPKQQVAANF